MTRHSTRLLSALVLFAFLLNSAKAAVFEQVDDMLTPTPSVEDPSPSPRPRRPPNITICFQKDFYSDSLGCVCYLRHLDILYPFDDDKRKKIFCTGGFGIPKLKKFRMFCKKLGYVRNGQLRIGKALRGLNRFTYNCLGGSSIINEIPEGSKYRRLFE